MNMTDRIHSIEAIIRATEVAYHRTFGSVSLLAVSKGQSIAKIQAAIDAGILEFGENYWQEAQPKIQHFEHMKLHWHFIGRIQSNKASEIAHHFSWVHSLNRLKIAQILHDARPQSLPALNVCIQVNFDNHTQKEGLKPQEVRQLLPTLLPLSRLVIRGLMVIPEPELNPEKQWFQFSQLTALLHSLNEEFSVNMDTLSMGMSNDYQMAIRAGSTIVRLGSILFGARFMV